MPGQHELLQIRDHTRILSIIPEAIPQIVAITREEANPLQYIQLRPHNQGRIHTEVPEVILYLPEAAWNDQVILQDHMAVPLLREVAGHPHHTAEVQDQEVHTLQVLPLQVLHQVVVLLQAEVLPQEEDSFKQ